jgi:tRNA wybutosine-synthesizing protein 4
MLTRGREETLEKHTRQPCSLTFVEIDHNAVIEEKAGIVNATQSLREACVGGDGVRRMGENEDGLDNSKEKKNAFADGGGYVMCACDLRDARALDAALSETARLDPNVPTLFLSECCLAYLEAEEASEVLRWAASWGGREGEGKSLSLPDPPPLRAYFAYDPSLIGDANDSEKNANARDRFGEQMLLNLRARGCPLLGAEKTRGVAAHVERARRNGWEIAGAVDMLAASKRLAYENPSESRRVAFIEPLDELEEYELIQAHYVVSWGVRGADDDAARLERVVDRSA